jgi:hypothetical protein
VSSKKDMTHVQLPRWGEGNRGRLIFSQLRGRRGISLWWKLRFKNSRQIPNDHQGDLENVGLQVLRFHDRDVKHDMRNVLQNWIEQRGKVLNGNGSTGGHPPTLPSKRE